MDIDSRPIVVALLAVVAIAIAAATLTTPVDVGGGDGDGFTTGSDEGSLAGEDSQGGTLFNVSSDDTDTGALIELPCVEWLADPGVIALALLGAVVIALAVWYRYDIVATMALFSVAMPPVILIFLILTNCVPAGSEPGLFAGAGEQIMPGGEDGGNGDGDESTAPPLPTVALFVLVGVSILAVALAMLASGSDDRIEEIDEAETQQSGVAAVGRIAGRAADRIEDDADANNAIYRAWREMTEYLDVDNPQASTPAEFADAAVDVGMARDDVTELTRLFEEVRYGGEDPTEDRSERARRALRRIEETYTPEE